MGSYVSLWGFMGLWINMNNGWVYLCMVCRWCVCVFMGTYMRIYACLWEPMEGYGYGPKHP